MLWENVKATIRKDIELVATKFEQTTLKLQEIRQDVLAGAHALQMCKKKGNIKPYLEYFNIPDDDKSINTANKQFFSNIKTERDSTELQDIPMNATSVETESTFVKKELDLMPPPIIRPKRGRKKNADQGSIASSSSSNSTRSSARTTRSNTLDTSAASDVVCTEPILECLTLSDEEPTISGKDENKIISAVKRSTRLRLNANNCKSQEMSPPSTRSSIRSKRSQQKKEEIKDEINTLNQSLIETKLLNETKSLIHNEVSTITSTTDIAQRKINEIKPSNVLESSNQSEMNGKPDRNKRLRSPTSDHKKRHTTKRSKSYNSDTPADGDISGQSVYEDASEIKRDNYKLKLNAVVILDQLNVTSISSNINQTYNHDKRISADIVVDNSNSKTQANATVVISPKGFIQNKTIVCEKNVADEGFNGLDDIMTDDESPSQTTTKSKAVHSDDLHSQPSVLKKITGIDTATNSSPVKKLVQVFEKMGKDCGLYKERFTPLAPRQIKNITPTQQNKLYSATGSASKANTIPVSSTRAGTARRPCSSAASTSAIKRNAHEFQERELLRRQKEEDIRKKREQQMQAQAEERRKRVEAQELKMLHVQQKKELLKQQKLQQIDVQQRMKEDKVRLVLQEKQERMDKHKEELEKKRQRHKKPGALDGNNPIKPIYLTHPTPLLITTDCYDSDEENANVKTTRVKPSWTTKDQLYSILRLMSKWDSSAVKYDFFATKPCTPNLVEIFQDIDPMKLNRTSSAVWRILPRATLMHLPSFTEEAQTAD